MSFKVKFGRHTNEAQFFLDGEEITGKLLVKKLTFVAEPEQATKVTMEVYADEIELESDDVTFTKVGFDNGE